MAQQTAVEWFQQQIIKIVNGECELSEIEIFEQAKAMEREQSIAFAKIVADQLSSMPIFPLQFIEYIYNETYQNKELLLSASEDASEAIDDLGDGEF